MSRDQSTNRQEYPQTHHDSSQPSRCNKILNALDIFSYIPVPQSFPVSTKKSKMGSVLIICMILGYTIYDFVGFLINNVPTVSIYDMPPKSGLVPVPNMAIGFIYGLGLNQTLTNSSYFTITLLQTYQQMGQPSKTTTIPMLPNCNPSWMGNLTTMYSNLSCANTTDLKLQGLLFGSYDWWYPRFQVNLCVNSSSCVDQTELYQMTAGGRIFLFVQKSPSVDFSTGDEVKTGLSCQIFNYFLVPSLYNRISITLMPVSYLIYPDYLTSFRVQTINQLIITGQELQNSNVSIYNTANVLSLNLVLASKSQKVDIHYSTIITHISLWGALWGVLFSLFAIIFLSYNKRKFTRAHPDWERFDKKVAKLQDNILKAAVGEVNNKNFEKQEIELPDISTLRRKFMETTES